MEKIICSSCGAAIIPDPSKPVLVCEYCDAAMPNAYYVEGHAAPAAPDLPALCIQTLVEMGQNENIASVQDGCFGNPLQDAYAVRDAMAISSREKVYFQLIRSNLLYTVAEGIALTDSGLYYKLDRESGSRPWEAFITGAIACTDRSAAQQGTLTIGTSLAFPIDSDEDSRLARFLIDFHNTAYHKHTGQAAPAAWCVTAAPAYAQESTGSFVDTLVKSAVPTTLGGMVLSGVKSLLQRSTTQRHIVQRPTVTRTIKQPRQQRRHIQQEPLRPLARPDRPLSSPPRHQQRMAQPGGIFRQSDAPGRVGNPGDRKLVSPGGRMGGPGGRGMGPGGRTGGPGGRRR